MDKCFVITGAGTGIGQAAALELGNSNNNHCLILVGRREGPLYDTLALLNNPQRHIVATADVREQAQLIEIAEKADLKNKSLSGLFVNAGIGGVNQAGSTDRWFDIINTNLTGAYNTVHAFLPFLKESDAPKKNILFTSSILAKIGVPGYEAYCASKAGLLGLTRSLAVGLAEHNIAVNAICPGWVDTKMARDGVQQMADAMGKDFDVLLERELKKVPFNRMSTPTEIGKWVKFLFTGSQQSITGQSLDVNNGAFMA